VFFAQIAALTRDHHRTHIREYLDLVNLTYDRPIALELPKQYDTTTILGGVVGVSRETLPAYTCFAFRKLLSSTNENLWTYQYEGRLNAMFAAATADQVEDITKRHQAATELFITRHGLIGQHLKDADPLSATNFLIVEMIFQSSAFFGAAQVKGSATDDAIYWIDGFQTDIVWTVSENGPGQHDG
jgi:hypothetical protein